MTDENKGVQLIEVGAEYADQRIDNFLSSRLKGVPRSHLYRLIRKGEIRVNKKRVKPESRLQAGDIVRVAPVRVASRDAPLPPGAALSELLQKSLVLDNADLMIVNKPQGLAVHAGSGVNLGLIEALRQIYPQYEFLELVHRIDKETSGCVMVAKNSKTLKHLQEEIKARRLHKTYLALVHGSWPEALEEVDAPLHKQSAEAGSGIVRVAAEGKQSLTRFSVVQRFQGATLIQAMPITGRTHQIRVHCQHAGHPIVGDDKYTPARPGALSTIRHLCLHAWLLNFTLPGRDKRYKAQAPMGSNMAAAISRLQALQDRPGAGLRGAKVPDGRLMQPAPQMARKNPETPDSARDFFDRRPPRAYYCAPMADTLVPDHVDARKIFTKEAEIKGILPVRQLQRLTQNLADGEGTVHAELKFATDDARRRIITGTVQADVNAICQRCLEAVAIQLDDTLNLAIVETEEQARNLPTELDPWMADDTVLKLPDLIEEQLILAMPLVSYHPEGECTGVAARIRDEKFSAAAVAAADSTDADGPFAILKNLKKPEQPDV